MESNISIEESVFKNTFMAKIAATAAGLNAPTI